MAQHDLQKLQIPSDFLLFLEQKLTLGSKHSRTDVKDPAGEHLLLLARGKEGYHSLSRVLTKAHLASMEKGTLQCDLNTLADEGGKPMDGLNWMQKKPRQGTSTRFTEFHQKQNRNKVKRL